MNEYLELENLLKQHEENTSNTQYNPYGNMLNGVHDSQRLRANRSASLKDFIKMIDKVTTLTFKEENVMFIPDEAKIDFISNDKKLDNPFINYKVIQRIPKKERKPRHRESRQEIEKNSTRNAEIYGQTFSCLLQFNIFANDWTTAEDVLEKFEDAIFIYSGFFKKNGVSEILFEKQYTDNFFESTRQVLSIRSVVYYVEIEKLTVIMEENIKEIDTY